MASLPTPIHTTAAMIYRQYERNAEGGHRPHLGASIIGHACDRYLWMTFHWAKESSFEGRMLRLFDTGKLEEKRICKDLLSIGCEVYEDDGTGQYRVSALGGHFGGSMDAVINGYHEAPTQWMPVEMKTHNAKSFKELTEKRLKSAKPMHYSQLTIYAGLSNMSQGLYFAVNKDTDQIYTERVKFDQEEFDRLMARAERVIRSPEPPLRISNDPSWYQCKMCHMNPICHGTEVPEVNCRTCAHSTPNTNEDGGWYCSAPGTSQNDVQPLHIDFQRTGCESHRYIPVLLENIGEVVDANEKDNWVAYKNKATGNVFYNGDLSSHEIYDCQNKSMLGDPSVNDFRYELGAKVVA